MRNTAFAALLLALPVACGSTSVPQKVDAPPATVYPIGANTADTILKDAMSSEFAADKIDRISAPHMGFKATTYAALDHYTVSVYRVQANGRRANGTTIPGFYFEVKTAGVSLESALRADRIRNRILAAAKLESGGFPLATSAPWNS